MPKDFDDLYKKLDQNNRSNQKDSDNVIKAINVIGKDNDKLTKEINEIKREVKDIAFKVDTMLEILNSFTIMLAEDDEDLEENYEFDNDTEETWVPKEDDFWEDDDET
jgi:septal ring factor EnvC (AmiA/AmiB activator)